MADRALTTLRMICDPDYLRFCELVFADQTPGDGGTTFARGAVKFGFANLSETAEFRRLYKRARRKLLADFPRMEGVLCRLDSGGSTKNLVDEVEQATGLKGFALNMKAEHAFWEAAAAVPSRKPLREVPLDF